MPDTSLSAAAENLPVSESDPISHRTFFYYSISASVFSHHRMPCTLLHKAPPHGFFLPAHTAHSGRHNNTYHLSEKPHAVSSGTVERTPLFPAPADFHKHGFLFCPCINILCHGTWFSYLPSQLQKIRNFFLQRF